MRRLTLTVVAILGVALATACGGKSSPSNPTPTLTSITVTSAGTGLHLTVSETFTATAVFSDASTQAITTGVWGSEQTSIASVDSATGRVTGLASGEATIFVTFQGVRGTKRITVRPNYGGIWAANYVVATCAQSGTIGNLNFCGQQLGVGNQLPYTLNLTQTNASATVTGQTALGTLVSNPFNATVAVDGTMAVNATYLNATLTIAQVWGLNITEVGKLTGTLTQTWTDTTLTGQLQVTVTLLPATLQANAAGLRLPSRAPDAGLLGAIQAIGLHLR